MTACEFLHCTKTELRERCKTDADFITILAYVKEKNKREKEAVEESKQEAEQKTKMSGARK